MPTAVTSIQLCQEVIHGIEVRKEEEDNKQTNSKPHSNNKNKTGEKQMYPLLVT